MPSKGRQRASRQAQLKSRRRKGRAQVVDSRRDVTEITSTDSESDSTDGVRAVSHSVQNVDMSAKPAQIKPQTSKNNAGALTYRYLGSEIKQIGLVASVIIVLLIAFTFVPM